MILVVIMQQNQRMIVRVRACCICKRIIHFSKKWDRKRPALRRLHGMYSELMPFTKIQVRVTLFFSFLFSGQTNAVEISLLKEIE